MVEVMPKTDYIYVTKSDNERSLNPEILKNKMNLKTEQIFNDYKKAFKSAKDLANKEDLVLVTGSAFLIGDILKEFY
jgi:dihydrofolate synthase/folylpolyglutamate synthase